MVLKRRDDDTTSPRLARAQGPKVLGPDRDRQVGMRRSRGASARWPLGSAGAAAALPRGESSIVRRIAQGLGWRAVGRFQERSEFALEVTLPRDGVVWRAYSDLLRWHIVTSSSSKHCAAMSPA